MIAKDRNATSYPCKTDRLNCPYDAALEQGLICGLDAFGHFHGFKYVKRMRIRFQHVPRALNLKMKIHLVCRIKIRKF